MTMKERLQIMREIIKRNVRRDAEHAAKQRREKPKKGKVKP